MTHTSTTWDGVVMIERRNPATNSAIPEGMCLVRSARSGVLGGMRAIVHQAPLAAVSKYFRSQDEDHVFVRAELQGRHLELRERCTLSEWAGTAHVLPTSH
jgi:hypothetical protein